MVFGGVLFVIAIIKFLPEMMFPLAIFFIILTFSNI